MTDERDLVAVNERLSVPERVKNGELVLCAHHLVREQLAMRPEVLETEEAYIEV